MKKPLAALALVAAVIVAGVFVLHDKLGAGSAQRATPPTVTLWAGEDVVNARGNHLFIGNVIVAADRLTIQYRATGSSFNAQGLSVAGQPPTQLLMTVDGKALTPLGGSVGGDPRILGNPNANWVADFDLQSRASK